MAENEFKFEEEKTTTKEVITISGLKGTGKTTTMFKFKGNHYCFSFDHKSTRIKEYLYDNDSRIKIIDGEKYYIRTKDLMVPTAAKNYAYLLAILDYIEGFGDADWIDFDCLQNLHEQCEMLMRNSHDLGPFDGFKEKTWWKERRVALGALHRRALLVAKRGVIYTTFMDIREDLLIDDEYENILAMPRYFDMIKDETDVIFKTLTKFDKDTGKLKFLVRVVSSKVPRYETGKLMDVTRE